MANVLYNSARAAFATAGINWTSDDIRMILIDTAQYTFSQSHDNLDDVAAGSRIATVALSGEASLGSGAVDATDPTFAAVTSGKTVGAIILYKHTGTEGTSRLIAYYDTGTNLPIATNGGDITVAINASGLFQI